MAFIALIFPLVRLKNWLWEKFGWTSLPPLREFVYMEEDTVISLLASTTGGITEQQTTGQKKRISSSITGNLGAKQAGVKSNVGTTKEESSEVVRQYVIESNFKELYDMRNEELVVSDNPELDQANPSVISDDKDSNGDDCFGSDVSTSELERGDLIEVDVELGSAEIFDYYRVIQAFDDIFETITSKSDLRDQLDTQDISSEEIRMIIELMEILMADLIPIVGEAKNYAVAEDLEVIIEKEWADKKDIEYTALNVVGFVDEENLWLDPTRVLFDRAEFTVYARVDNSAAKEEWMPMKLLDVVDKVFPGIGDDIKNLPNAFDDRDSDGPQPSNTGDNPSATQTTLRTDLYRYLEEIENELDHSIDEDERDEIVEEITETWNNSLEPNINDKIDAFKQSENMLDDREYDITVDKDLRATLTSRLWREDEIDLDSEDQTTNEGYYLESSFVAIYW